METSQYIQIFLKHFFENFFSLRSLLDSDFFYVSLTVFFILLIRNFFPKKCWIFYGAGVALLAAREIQFIILGKADLLVPGAIIIFVFCGLCFVSKFFILRKVKYWLVFLAVLVIGYGVNTFLWTDPPIDEFGSIEDGPIPENVREERKAFDYEMQIFYADAWYHDARMAIFRVKKDSVFSCLQSETCGFPKDYEKLCQWTLADVPARSSLDSLKEMAENYKLEYTDITTFDGYVFNVLVMDFEKGRRRLLELGNACVPNAIAIVEKALPYLPPYDTSYAHQEELKKCYVSESAEVQGK